MGVDEATEDTNVASAIESRVASSLHLGSPTEYRYWLVALVKRLAKAGQETRLRALLDSLLGPSSKSSSSWTPEVLGIKKRTLLMELLPHVASNMALQRLYSEYNTQTQGLVQQVDEILYKQPTTTKMQPTQTLSITNL